MARRVLSSPWLGEEAERASKSKDSRAFLTGSTSFLGTIFSRAGIHCVLSNEILGFVSFGFNFTFQNFDSLISVSHLVISKLVS